jgi:hypothetical protein
LYGLDSAVVACMQHLVEGSGSGWPPISPRRSTWRRAYPSSLNSQYDSVSSSSK